MADERLTDIERTWLVSIDALLIQTTVDAHGAVAGRFIDLWFSGGPTFRAELTKRASLWRQRHVKVQQLILNSHGACERLVRLMGNPRPPQQEPKKTNSKPQGDRVMPSTRQFGPVRQISDEEVKQFMDLLDAEGISVLFDPGVSFTTKGELYKPPLIRLDGKPIDYEQIAPAYDRGAIERAWDAVQREPAIALAFDLALLAIAQEKKWTWVVCDRYFARLPWGHPYKAGPEGRPGWKLVTWLLEGEGLIELKAGQTWRLTAEGQSAARRAGIRWSSPDL
ncbi:MAG: hypothetical protein ACF8MF_02230 [Phycisphaerales bacterium JB052]